MICKIERVQLYFFFLIFTTTLYAQTITIPDTICVNELLEIEYNGNAQEFCILSDASFINYHMSTDTISTYPENEVPLFIHFVQDEAGNYYGFTTNFNTNNIVRLEFGNSLLNTPTSFTFPLNVIAGDLEGVQIIKDNNNWWGFVTGGTGIWEEEYFLRLNFGNSLSNIPTVENLGGIGELSFPHDLFITKENGNWIGVTINKFNNTITRFEFGDNLSNIPTATNLGNIGNLFRPTGFFPIQVEGAWHLFITNPENNTLSRVDFGSSLSNIPTGINLGKLELLDRPRDLLITKICDPYLGLVLNRTNNEIIVLFFGDDIKSVPFSSVLGNLENLSFPHAISKLQLTEEGFVFFVTNVDSKQIIRVRFEMPMGVDVECKESLFDFEIIYEEPGIYNLEIIVNQGLPDQNTFCKDIVVLPSPDFNIGNDTSLCEGASLLLNSNFNNTIWQNEVQANSFEVLEAGQYIAEITEQGCTVKDSIYVEFTDCEKCISFPNVFTPNQDGINDIFSPVLECEVEFTTFQLQIYNRWGQKVFETNNPEIGWDGNFKNKPAPNEVYAWAASFSYANGIVVAQETKGNLTLIR